MKTGFIACVLALSIGAPDRLWSAPEKKEAWHFVHSEISLGRLRKDQSVPVVFEVKNETDQPIKIASAEGSCRCTSLEDAPDVIPAHGTATFKWVFDASRSEGAVDHGVTVEADDGRTIDGTFKAVVEEPAPASGMPKPAP